MIKMVVGFLFSGPKVLLVRKNRPEWQAGLLNGVGGKVEENETPAAAMTREFLEETRCSLPLDWRLVCSEFEEPQKALIYFYAARIEHPITMPTHNDVGEELWWCHIWDLDRARKLGNLSWIIPLALDPRRVDAVPVNVRGDVREMPTW